MRKLIITIGVLIMLFIIVAALAILNLNFFINGNKDFFLSQIEQSLGRKLTIAEINTGFREGLGIRLKNASISDDKAFSDTDFIRASDIQINVGIIPLLSKKIVINKLILNKPVITIIENTDGEYNFETLGSEGKSNKNNKTESSNKTSNIPLLASSIVIEDGQINFIDEKNETEIQIQKINLKISDLALGNKIPVNLQAAVLSIEPNLKLNGTIGPIASDLDFNKAPLYGELEIDDLNINTLKKFIPDIDEYIPDGLDISGPLEAELRFAGSLESLKLSDMKINASVFGASVPNFELSGDIGPIGSNKEAFSLNTQFSLQRANLSKLRKFSLIKDSIPNSLSSQGTLDVSGKIRGTPANMEFVDTRIDATRSRLAIIGKFLKPMSIPFSITMTGTISKDLIELKSSNITLSTIALKANGEINRGITNLINLSVKSNKIDLSEVGDIFTSIREYSPDGWIRLLPTTMTGELGKGQIPQINGRIELADVSIEPPSFPEPIKNINTKINFTGKTADINKMILSFGNSKISISSRIDKFSPLTLSYNIESPELYLSDLTNGESKNGKTAVLKGFKSKGKLSNKDNGLMVKGEMSSADATLSEYELKGLSTKYSVISETIRIEDFRVNAYEGTIEGNGSYSLGGESGFSMISVVRGMNLKSFLDSIDSENANKIEGRANLDINIFGSGKNWDQIKKTLKGTSKMEIVDGAVLDINISDQVLKGITGVPGLTFLISKQTKDKYPQIFKTQDTEFQEFKSSFIIDKGKMETTNLKITSKDYSITGKGWMNLDGKLDMKSLLTLSKEFSSDLETDIPDLRFIANNDQQIEIPFVIRGTLPKAKARPDIAYLSKLVQREGIRSVIEGLTSSSEDSQNTEEDQKEKPAKKEEKRLDEKIFDEIKDLF